MTVSCPNQQELRLYALGRLSASATDTLTQHVVGCPRCDAILTQFDFETDPLTSGLRAMSGGSVSATENRPAEDVSEELLQRARDAIGVHIRSLQTDHGLELSQKLDEHGSCKLDRFELLEELGAGSFGRVFKAWDVDRQQNVAIKVERVRLENDQEDDRFHREARSAARLDHPGIVSFIEVGETEEGIRFLVSRFVEGETLEQRIDQGGFSHRDAAKIVADVAESLQHAHSKGVIHRDLKPSNVLLDNEGFPYITDFGLAKTVDENATLTVLGDVMGTPGYMSPEQARGDAHSADERSDVYSLGVILYELLTGQRPFQGNRRMVLLQVLEDQPRAPQRLDSSIPSSLQAVCLRAMSKERSDRYQSAGEFAQDLKRFLGDKPTVARPPGKVKQSMAWCNRNPVAAALLSGVTIGSVAGFAYLSSLSHWFVQQAALESVRLQARAIEQFNTLYSEGAANLPSSQVGTTEEFREGHKPTLFPASFTIEAGRRMEQDESGMRVSLYSEYPFPWRTDGGPQDSFQSLAIRQLQQNPSTPFYRFTELNGEPVLRYSIARVMESSCIQCHNEHPQTPKDDWKVGDVRGVLEITRPLDRDRQRTARGLRGAFLLIGLVAVTLTAIALGLLRSSARRREQPS